MGDCPDFAGRDQLWQIGFEAAMEGVNFGGFGEK